MAKKNLNRSRKGIEKTEFIVAVAGAAAAGPGVAT